VQVRVPEPAGREGLSHRCHLSLDRQPVPVPLQTSQLGQLADSHSHLASQRVALCAEAARCTRACGISASPRLLCLQDKVPFPKLVMEVLKKLEGAYALLIKSSHYPGGHKGGAGGRRGRGLLGCG
jgi:hypothetical protein